MKKNTIKDLADKLNVTSAYLCAILKGKKSCNKERMKQIKKYYPEVKFYVSNKYYKVKENEDE